MTLTFNPDRYKDLLVRYQPKLIRTEEDNEKALAIVEELMPCPNRSPEENELYELLVALIEKFEQEYYLPGTASAPHSMLLFLMEQQNLKSTDLVSVFETEEVISAVINGERGINQAEANALGKLFHVESGVFFG